jgi:solute carrier family 50 protein (sugar transporter)
MFLAPLDDVRKAAHTGDLGDLNPLPWPVMLGNCLGWVVYGLLLRNWFIFFGNALGFLLSIYFTTTAMKILYAQKLREEKEKEPMYTQPNESTIVNKQSATLLDHVENRQASGIANPILLPAPSISATLDDTTPGITTSPLLIVTSTKANTQAALSTNTTDPPASKESDHTIAAILPSAAGRLQFLEQFALVIILVWLSVITCTVTIRSMDEGLRQLVVGCVVNTNLAFFYGAPLSTIRQVIQTQSSRWLHFPTMLRKDLHTLEMDRWSIDCLLST